MSLARIMRVPFDPSIHRYTQLSGRMAISAQGEESPTDRSETKFYATGGLYMYNLYNPPRPLTAGDVQAFVVAMALST